MNIQKVYERSDLYESLWIFKCKMIVFERSDFLAAFYFFGFCVWECRDCHALLCNCICMLWPGGVFALRYLGWEFSLKLLTAVIQYFHQVTISVLDAHEASNSVWSAESMLVCLLNPITSLTLKARKDSEAIPFFLSAMQCGTIWP